MPRKSRRSIRNPVARAPILRKGGVHEKSTKAKRKNHKQALQRQLREGRPDRPFSCPDPRLVLALTQTWISRSA